MSEPDRPGKPAREPSRPLSATRGSARAELAPSDSRGSASRASASASSPPRGSRGGVGSKSRVITALVCLGILCVGASAYLVTLTVEYFEGIVGSATQKSDHAVDLALPFYDGYVKARKSAYRARLEAMAREVELAVARDELKPDDPAALHEFLHELPRREPDLVELSATASAPSAASCPRTSWPRVLGPHSSCLFEPAPPGPVPIDHGSLNAIFALEPQLDRDYQRLGEIKRGLNYIAVDGTVVDRGELERAVYRGFGAASALVLMVAFIAGFLLARATTRKLSMLSDAMLRVAGGDLQARVPDLGNDELGQLGAAFNGMLDELASAQRKLSYLQRVGAWQDMARRIAQRSRTR